MYIVYCVHILQVYLERISNEALFFGAFPENVRAFFYRSSRLLLFVAVWCLSIALLVV